MITVPDTIWPAFTTAGLSETLTMTGAESGAATGGETAVATAAGGAPAIGGSAGVAPPARAGAAGALAVAAGGTGDDRAVAALMGGAAGLATALVTLLRVVESGARVSREANTVKRSADAALTVSAGMYLDFMKPNVVD